MEVHPLNSKDAYAKLRPEQGGLEGPICYIFGAGASYGYTSDEHSIPPPVVANLFSDSNASVRSAFASGLHSNIARERDDLENILAEFGDLESYLEDSFEKNPDEDLFPQLLFYLQDVMARASATIDKQNTNNYIRLIRAMRNIRGQNWSSISFNYDTILEQSLKEAGPNEDRRFNLIEHYDEPPRVVKIHGSINLRYQLADSASTATLHTRREIFKGMMGIDGQISGTIRLLPSLTATIPPFALSKMEQKPGAGNLMMQVHYYDFPTMMVPIHHKDHTGGLYFTSLMETAVREIDKSSIIVVIGYNFADQAFVSKIKEIDTSKKELILVGAKDFSENPESNLGYLHMKDVWKGKLFIFSEVNEGWGGFGSFVRAISRASGPSVAA